VTERRIRCELFTNTNKYFIDAVLSFDPSDPAAVHLRLTDEVTWTFGRELLAAGLEAPTGAGDIQVWPLGRFMGIAMRSDDGWAWLLTNQLQVADFAVDVAEHYPDDDPDVDGFLAQLFKESQ
jgi:hypothetical protein